MKLNLLFLLACLLVAGCSCPQKTHPPVLKTTYSSFDQLEEVADQKIYGPGDINFKNAHLKEFLPVYQDISGRTVIASPQLPQGSVTAQNATPISRIQMLQLFDTALAQNAVAMVYSGENTVKAVPIAQAAQEAGPVIDLPADKLPESSSYMVRFVRLKNHKPSEVVPMIQPFAQVPNGIIALENERMLVLRDFSSNIRQMLKLIDEVEAGTSAGR